MPRKKRKNQESEIFDYFIKLLILGDSAVGKSSLLMRFCEEKFSTQFVLTIGVDFKTKILTLPNGQRLKVQVWDTAGQERFRTITPAYYRSAMGVILTFDLTSAESFSNIRYWLKNIREHAESNIAKVLIGNKCDLENKRQVSSLKARAFAEEHEICYFETSAKASINVDAAFRQIAMDVVDKRFKACLGASTSSQPQAAAAVAPPQRVPPAQPGGAAVMTSSTVIGSVSTSTARGRGGGGARTSTALHEQNSTSSTTHQAHSTGGVGKGESQSSCLPPPATLDEDAVAGKRDGRISLSSSSQRSSRKCGGCAR